MALVDYAATRAAPRHLPDMRRADRAHLFLGLRRFLPKVPRGLTMALHEQSVGATDEWYTPPHVFDALGCSVDVDAARPGAAVVPWIPAAAHITTNSLTSPCWRGFVWMTPPLGARNGLVPWLERFFQHGNGIALVPDRTSAPWWQKY